jgi:hypothetical protein
MNNGKFVMSQKNIKAGSFLLLLTAACYFLTGCPESFQEFQKHTEDQTHMTVPDGYGAVRVNIAGNEARNEARTVFPSIQGLTYEYFFTRAASRTVVVDMYASASVGWKEGGALRINVNGVDIASVQVENNAANNTPGNQRDTNRYIFNAAVGDVVQFYSVRGYVDFQTENSFIVYYADTPPSPSFSWGAKDNWGPTSWNGINALLYRVHGNASNGGLGGVTHNTLLGSFTVTSNEDETFGIPEEKTPVNGLFTLETGIWTLLVNAYIDNNLAATGTTERAFSLGTGATVNLTITLSPIASALSGTGTFKYNITYPAGAVITMFKLANMFPAAGPEEFDLTSGGNEGEIPSIPAGYYLLRITLTKDGKGAGKNEVVHIYDSLTSEYTAVLADNDFTVCAFGHDWNEWQEITAPVFTINGTETRTCKNNNCDITETRAVDALTSVIITNTNEWNSALSAIQNNGSNKNYTITVSGNVAVPGITSAITANTGFGNDNTGVTVVLQGNGKLYLNSQGSIIRLGSFHTLIIDSENLILEGLKSGQNSSGQDNNNSIIYVQSLGRLELINGKISGNKNGGSGGGVYIFGGSFTMGGGIINGNTSVQTGGGVYIDGGGAFIMKDGEIKSNTAELSGGGVSCERSFTFTMEGGEISGNSATSKGGGVYVDGGIYNCLFTMKGGVIRSNTSSGYGGGVSVYAAPSIYSSNIRFIMEGGAISANTGAIGGGVCIDGDSTSQSSKFTMKNGLINGNNAMNGGGVVVRSGSAITMEGGEISSNTASSDGGGVYVYAGGTFTMGGGIINGNTVAANGTGGGGVYVSGTYNMEGGIISGNTFSGAGVNKGGGGVHASVSGNFNKSGGNIYGNNGGSLSNSAPNSTGHAVYWLRRIQNDNGTTTDTPVIRDTTLGENDNFSTSVVTYTVTFNGNGATSGTTSASRTVGDGTIITLPEQGTLLKSGFSFRGWNTTTSGTGINYTAGSSYVVTGNVTLYAEWGSPNTPANVSASAVSSSSITVSWDSVSGAAWYYVYRSSSADGTYTRVGNTITSTSFTNTGLSMGATYYYKVSAYNDAGESSQSSPVSAAVGWAVVSVTNVYGAFERDHVQSWNYIRWSVSWGASGYYVYRSTTESGSYTRVGSTTASQYEDYNGSRGATYYYKVSAYNNAGEGPLSSPVSVTFCPAYSVSGKYYICYSNPNSPTGDDWVNFGSNKIFTMYNAWSGYTWTGTYTVISDNAIKIVYDDDPYPDYVDVVDRNIIRISDTYYRKN